MGLLYSYDGVEQPFDYTDLRDTQRSKGLAKLEKPVVVSDSKELIAESWKLHKSSVGANPHAAGTTLSAPITLNKGFLIKAISWAYDMSLVAGTYSLTITDEKGELLYENEYFDLITGYYEEYLSILLESTVTTTKTYTANITRGSAGAPLNVTFDFKISGYQK